MLDVGHPLPDLKLPGPDGKPVRLRDLAAGKVLVIYFYPKDDTPGCTRQACDLRDRWSDFEATGALVYGISPDPVRSHVKFRDKYELPFRLLADTDHQVAEAYGVWKEKTFMGRKYMGNERTTFIIDEDGRIQKIFPEVKPDEHAELVLAALAA